MMASRIWLLAFLTAGDAHIREGWQLPCNEMTLLQFREEKFPGKVGDPSTRDGERSKCHSPSS
jgi:hypothetical protein